MKVKVLNESLRIDSLLDFCSTLIKMLHTCWNSYCKTCNAVTVSFLVLWEFNVSDAVRMYFFFVSGSGFARISHCFMTLARDLKNHKLRALNARATLWWITYDFTEYRGRQFISRSIFCNFLPFQCLLIA